MPAVTSLQVAEAFGKRHDHVLRDIAALLSQTPEIFVKPNFGEHEAEYFTGFGMKKTPAYLLSKDGFALLTMGYTGERAMRFKVAYIQRFNEMEAELARRFPCLQGGKPAPLIPRKDGGARRGGRFGKVKHRKR